VTWAVTQTYDMPWEEYEHRVRPTRHELLDVERPVMAHRMTPASHRVAFP